jgi:hypothetical protein
MFFSFLAERNKIQMNLWKQDNYLILKTVIFLGFILTLYFLGIAFCCITNVSTVYKSIYTIVSGIIFTCSLVGTIECIYRFLIKRK